MRPRTANRRDCEPSDAPVLTAIVKGTRWVVGRPASLVGAAGRDQIAADDGMQVHSELLVAWLSGLTGYDAGGPDREGAPEARAAGGRGLGGASGGRALPERRRAAPLTCGTGRRDPAGVKLGAGREDRLWHRAPPFLAPGLSRAVPVVAHTNGSGERISAIMDRPASEYRPTPEDDHT